jgi:tRNA U38,U39,U40 pseudouridine synthase TruA
MVRLIVGSLVNSALSKLRIQDVAERLNSGQTGAPRFAAPAEGLFLVGVRY